MRVEIAFRVYLEQDRDRLNYSEPITGGKYSVPSPIRMAGIYPDGGVTLISCHFHPPGTLLIPSYEDLRLLRRYNLYQHVSGVRILDILGLANHEDVELLMLQQTFTNKVNNLGGDPVHSSFHAKMLEKTFIRFYPDQSDVVEELVYLCNSASDKNIARAKNLLPTDYAVILAEELERTGLYKASYKSLKSEGGDKYGI